MKSRKGFTLVEIIVALAIFAIVVGGSASLILSGSDVFRKNADMSHGANMSRYAIDWLEDNITYSSTVRIVDNTSYVPEEQSAIKIQASGDKEGQLMVYNNEGWEEALSSGFYEGWKIAIYPEIKAEEKLEFEVKVLNAQEKVITTVTKVISLLNYENLKDERLNPDNPYPMFLLDANNKALGGEPGNANNVAGYLATSESLLDQAISMTGRTWENLWDLYKEANDGDYPPISEDESDMLRGSASNYYNLELTWKPIILGIDGTDGMLMIATVNIGSTRNAYLVYYEGDYYYHFNGYNRKDSAYVSDSGGFDTNLLTNPPSSGSRWIKVE